MGDRKRIHQDIPQGCQNSCTYNSPVYVREEKTSIPATAQEGGEIKIHTCTNTKGRETNNIYVEGLAKLEPWCINKSKVKINIYGQDWWYFPKHKIEGNFYGMYMNHTKNKHDEWSE